MSQRAGNSHGKNTLASRQAFSFHRSSPLDVFFWSAFFASISLVALSGLTLSSFRVSASNPTSASASITVSSFCSMTATTDSAHEADIPPGVFRGNIGKTTFATICNDTNGYDIYAVGFTNDEFGRNDMLGSTTGRLIDTGTATSGDYSSWSMRLTSVSSEVAPDISTGYSDYHAVPNEYTKVVSYDGSTMAEPAGSKFETTYGSYIGSKQVADTYIGKVKYTLVHPSDSSSAPCASTYTINYNSNGGSGSMDSQTACVDRAISILPSSFTPPAPVGNNQYQFGAWNTSADGSGYAYSARQSVINIAEPGDTITLYAQWGPKYIQDLTPEMCSKLATSGPYTVIDKRDANDYTVRYLKGACWMTQNLRITGTVYSQYSNFNTYDTVNVCTDDLTAGNSLDEPRCHDSGNKTNGVWYNYASASAKTITGSNSTIATEDICPAGWHLPSYDTAKPAGSVNSLLDMTALESAAFQPVTGGSYDSGTLKSADSSYWWSTVAEGTIYRYYLGYNGSSLSTSIGYYRGFGFYVRCVRE